MRCRVFHVGGQRTNQELDYEQIGQLIRAGSFIVATYKWDDDPQWEDKANLLLEPPP